MKINIAIDGPSAAGKSTIAKLLAKSLGYTHLDTGAMYRCVAYAVITNGINSDHEEDIIKMMDTLHLEFKENNQVYIDGENVTSKIRTNDISMMASKVSAYPLVRKRLVALQQEIAKNKGYILDGRDIGTVVLPDAECKIYMIASVEARAKRRYKEYVDQNIDADYDEIYKDIEKRDYQDTHRASSPLKKSEDAIEIDTSNMTIDEVIQEINKIINQ